MAEEDIEVVFGSACGCKDDMIMVFVFMLCFTLKSSIYTCRCKYSSQRIDIRVDS